MGYSPSFVSGVGRRERVLSLLLVIGYLGMAAALLPAALSAQEMPPFPILYGGQAFLDGQPMPAGTRLVAKVRDYETWTTVEEDGRYRNLLVGPASRDYYGSSVTFHALGLKAQETDVFQLASAPVFKTQSFDLHFSGLAEESSPQPSGSPTPLSLPSPGPGTGDSLSLPRLAVGAGVVVAALAGWYVVRRKRAG